jgi:hypothetical protein
MNQTTSGHFPCASAWRGSRQSARRRTRQEVNTDVWGWLPVQNWGRPLFRHNGWRRLLATPILSGRGKDQSTSSGVANQRRRDFFQLQPTFGSARSGFYDSCLSPAARTVVHDRNFGRANTPRPFPEATQTSPNQRVRRTKHFHRDLPRGRTFISCPTRGLEFYVVRNPIPSAALPLGTAAPPTSKAIGR